MTIQKSINKKKTTSESTKLKQLQHLGTKTLNINEYRIKIKRETNKSIVRKNKIKWKSEEGINGRVLILWFKTKQTKCYSPNTNTNN